MCTLLIAYRVVQSAPVVVLANRDESLARPSLAPAVRNDSLPVFCGLDAKQGGTWFGINAYGLVAGLTNLSIRQPNPALRSRGLLCMDMLQCRNAHQVRRALRELSPDAYNPFNLIALDAEHAVRVRYDREPVIEELEPGVHATTNWPLDSEFDAKRQAIQSRATGLVAAANDCTDLWQGLKAEGRRHDGHAAPGVSTCCHAPGYGTRASTIVLLDTARRRVRVAHAEGAPCESPYIDQTHEVAAMLGFHDD